MTNEYLEPARLQALEAMVCMRIDDALGKLGISLLPSGRMYTGCCAVHGGNNNQALNLYPTGDTKPGYWRCYTRLCHKHFPQTVIGFIRGVLSHQRFGWFPPDRPGTQRPKVVAFRDTIGWCCELIGQKIGDIQFSSSEFEKRRFASGIASLTKRTHGPLGGLSREVVRKRLIRPARYLVERGFTEEALDRFDIGFCDDETKPFYQRVVVPIYDSEGKWAVGATARATCDRCPQCLLWHSDATSCPTDSEKSRFSKWTNTPGFSREGHLYNQNVGLAKARTTGVLLLVEGPMDVVRLWEAGIKGSVALLGSDLSDSQQILLETSGATDVVILTDMDAAGRAAAREIQQRLRRSFRLHIPELPEKDLGELRPVAVTNLLMPLLTKIHSRNT